MDEVQRRVDEIQFRSSEMENHLIDTYRKGGIDRREFVRRGTILGMSAGSIGFLASACGSGDKGGGGGGTTTSSDQQSASVKPGGKVTAAINSPAGAIDPITVADDGGLAVLGQAGEYLVWSDSELNAVPRLAESWTPNDDASVWTFKIRQGVKFHDGKEMTSEDVAESINRLADPDNASAALSAFNGFLTKDSAKATDATTVEFSLEAQAEGTRLRVVESGFAALEGTEAENAALAERHDGGWGMFLERLAALPSGADVSA